MRAPKIDFVRLTEIDVHAVAALLNEPRNSRHMPLAGTFSLDDAAAWVSAKDGQWEANGYGPWAVRVDGVFAGWCGFQAEENGADLGLVLLPSHWGRGEAIARQALDVGFRELGLTTVLIALPYSREPDRAVARFGFEPDGEVSYSGARFRQYRLERDAWLQGVEQPSAGS